MKCPFCHGTGLNLIGEFPRSPCYCEYCDGQGKMSDRKYNSIMSHYSRVLNSYRRSSGQGDKSSDKSPAPDSKSQ